ncbi:MAG: DUF4301 family protein [Prevotellaceae bacterium]|jgi:hypothetical protein|nr:DUF4301 family protein [Prevotellaceae bacterium]
MVINTNDLDVLKKRNISQSQIEEQLQAFATGFPYLKLKNAASVGNGITQFFENEEFALIEKWDNFLQTDAKIVKFVPASGAASRMFKDLFDLLESEEGKPQKPLQAEFFEKIDKFAFYDELNVCCTKNAKKNISTLISAGQFKKIAENLLLASGLNYGSLPKGLLKFHIYNDLKRTPAQEHLAEGALYAANKSKNIYIHFTVSEEHKKLFNKHLNENLPYFEQIYCSKFFVSFSVQKPSTDTIAADMRNEPFREKGNLVFRPGGHGALIENLNDIDADIIFIKNIDNVVPDRFKQPTVKYKKIIAGKLVEIREKCFAYLKTLENENVSDSQIDEIQHFVEKDLYIFNPHFEQLNKSAKIKYFRTKLNRPIRVCGMVKNEGEPGGGPFVAYNQDSTASLQILESSQIDPNSEKNVAMMKNATHFNPVDLVCATKNYKGEKFNLRKFVDKNTGFISLKSKNGKELKALELPGLWNGAMSDWNTVFVEVPIETFNPVKTVNDLLRTQHQ